MTASDSRAKAFTRIELLVVLAVIAVLASMIVPSSRITDRSRAKRISCVFQLKQIGTAYRIWSNDNGDRYPASVPQTNGGWRELANRPNASIYAWTNYSALGIDLGFNSKILVCPADERKPAGEFAALANTNISYFIGPRANEEYPQGILGGDRNLGPGSTPRDDYGFSPPDGRGNDVTIKGPVCW
ncbi:MAG TPA: type II secretion system protein, partial [Verrucomicrobiae bacterium]|nr:type II secretion system protein [Verrucomicrobiae bacterium]